jgi:hypothetical protein
MYYRSLQITYPRQNPLALGNDARDHPPAKKRGAKMPIKYEPTKEWNTLSNSEQFNIRELAHAFNELRPWDDADDVQATPTQYKFHGLLQKMGQRGGALAVLLVGWAVVSDKDRDEFWKDCVLKDFPLPQDWRDYCAKPIVPATAAVPIVPATPQIAPPRGRGRIQKHWSQGDLF